MMAEEPKATSEEQNVRLSHDDRNVVKTSTFDVSDVSSSPMEHPCLCSEFSSSSDISKRDPYIRVSYHGGSSHTALCDMAHGVATAV